VNGVGSASATKVPASWVRVRKSHRAMAGIIAGVIGAGMLFHGLYEGGLQLYLRAFGTAVDAEVVHVFRGRAGERTRIEVRFTDPQGRERELTLPSLSSALEPGRRVALRLVPRVPWLGMLDSQVRSHRALLEAGVIGGIGAVLMPLGLWLYLGFRWRARLARGVPPWLEADGRITARAERGYKLGGHHPTYLRYEFRAHDGRVYSGQSPDLPAESDAPAEGSVLVRYRPGDPARSVPMAWKASDERR